jgi:periplasmic divalent cation tolerance protein
MNTYLQVQTTTDSKEAAEALVSLLIEKKLAACVQVSSPITSVFTWKGTVTKAEEWLISAKTRSDLYEKIEQAIKENHSYELPEIIAVKLEQVSTDYAKWMEEQL